MPTRVVSGASVVEARARADLEQLLGVDVTVFSQAVRFAQAAAVACRGSGRTATEYAQAATEALPWYTAKATGAPVQRYSSAAAGLAADYRALADEVLGALAGRLARPVPAASSASASPTAPATPSRREAVG